MAMTKSKKKKVIYANAIDYCDGPYDSPNNDDFV